MKGTSNLELRKGVMSMSAGVFAEVEKEPWESVVAQHLGLGSAMVQSVIERSPFYRRQFAGAPSIRSWKDFSALPFTEKAQLRESQMRHPPFGEYLSVALTEVAQVQASSGTTGRPTYVPGTIHDVDVWAEMCARVKYAVGIRPDDSVLQVTSMGKGFVGGVPTTQGLLRLGCAVIPIGAEAGVDRLAGILGDLRPSAIVGTPSFVQHFGLRLQNILGEDASTWGVRRIAVGGEPGGGIPAMRMRLESMWHASVREMLGGSDFGSAYWGECEEASGMHFCGQGLLHFEIVDPESEITLPYESGVVGELVYTALQREAAPLVRFRTHDIVEVLGTSCDCGRTAPRLRCIGRSDDMLIVRGVNVFPSAIQDVVNSLGEDVTGIFRIHRDFEGYVTDRPLKIEVEFQPNVPQSEVAELAEQIHGLLAVRAEIIRRGPGEVQAIGTSKLSYYSQEPAKR